MAKASLPEDRDRLLIVYSNRSGALSVDKKIAAQRDIFENRFDVDMIETSQSSLFTVMRAIRGNHRILMRDSFSFSSIYVALLAGGKTVLEVNRPFGNLEGKRNRLFQLVRLCLFMVVFLRVKKIVCVTEEIRQSFAKSAFFGKTFYIPNISAYTSLNLTRDVPDKIEHPSLAFIGDLAQAWQGKTFIEQILRESPQARLLYIGKKTEFSEDIAGRVTQTGIIREDAAIIDRILPCTIGLSALNFQSRKMIEASPLKHGLYVAAGVWIVSGSRDNLLEGVYPIRTLLSPDEELESLIDSINDGTHRHHAEEALENRFKVLDEIESIKADYLELIS